MLDEGFAPDFIPPPTLAQFSKLQEALIKTNDALIALQAHVIKLQLRVEALERGQG